jgi:glucokinase
MAEKNVKKNGTYVLGVDLGGTKILAAVVSKDGKVISRAKKKTKADSDAQAIMQRMVDCCEEAMEKAKLTAKSILAIGVGSPGPLDPIEGKVLDTPNLNLKNAPIAKFISEKLKIKTFIDNDVNIGTLGEFTYGAGKGKKDIIGIFLGTGVGGGVIINGKLHHGYSLNAGELGHMKLVANGELCGCGQRGCLEAYASKTAMIRKIKEAIAEGKKSILPELIGDNWSKLTSKVFKKCVEEKDPLVVPILEEAAIYTGIGIGSLLNILSPELVVIGGGLCEALPDFFMPIIRNHAEKNSFPIMYKGIKIVPAALGDDAGILGAAALAWQRIK